MSKAEINHFNIFLDKRRKPSVVTDSRPDGQKRHKDRNRSLGPLGPSDLIILAYLGSMMVSQVLLC